MVRALRKLVVGVVYLIVVSALSFAVLETAATLLMSERLGKTAALYDAILGGSGNVLDMKKNYRARWETGEFKIDIETNRRGFRENFDFRDSDVDLAFMGDSFVFGHGVSVGDRFSSMVAKDHPGLVAASLSYNNGFQPEHYEFFLQTHPDLRPKVLFVTVYLGNDLDSDLAETIIARNAEGRIVRLELPGREIFAGNLVNKKHYRYGWLSILVERTYLGKFLAMKINTSQELRRKFWQDGRLLPNSPNRLTTERGELDEHNLRAVIALERIGEMVKARGGILHVLLVPQNYLLGKVKNPHIAPENARYAEELRSRNGLVKALLVQCAKSGLNCHDASQILTTEDYYGIDAHWNPSGHRKIGVYLNRAALNTFNR